MNVIPNLRFCLFILFFVSCHPGKQKNNILISADFLIETNPDSALILLESIPFSENLSEEEKAEYALLLTKVRDKKYIIHQTDSVIKIAVDYYKNINNKQKKSEAYFYLGSVYRDMQMPLEAIQSFQKALRERKGKEDRLTELIYNNLAMQYRKQGHYDEAITALRKSYSISSRQYREKDMVYAVRDLGNLFLFVNEQDSSLFYLNKAMDLAKNLDDDSWNSLLYCDIARVYYDKNFPDTAYQYLKKSLITLPPNESPYDIYFLMGRVFLKLNETDSARYYLKECLLNDNPYMYTVIRFHLAELERNAGNHQEAANLHSQYIQLHDSIKMVQKTEDARILIQEHKDLLKNQQRYESTRNKIILFLFLIAFLSAAIFFFYRKKRQAVKDQIPVSPEIVVFKEKIEKALTIAKNELKETTIFPIIKKNIESVKKR